MSELYDGGEPHDYGAEQYATGHEAEGYDQDHNENFLELAQHHAAEADADFDHGQHTTFSDGHGLNYNNDEYDHPSEHNAVEDDQYAQAYNESDHEAGFEDRSFAELQAEIERGLG